MLFFSLASYVLVELPYSTIEVAGTFSRKQSSRSGMPPPPQKYKYRTKGPSRDQCARDRFVQEMFRRRDGRAK